MKKIAIDIMGNDHGIMPAVKAAEIFLKNNLNFKIYLVGTKKALSSIEKNNKNIVLVEAKGEIKQEDSFWELRKKETSMHKALMMLKDKNVDAVISSGNSAILLGLATLIVKRIKKITKSAFSVVLNTLNPNKKAIILDVGANLEVSEEVLRQWSKMGSVLASIVNNSKNPAVSLLNIGVEDHKGTEVIKKANELLKKDKNINYQGFIEPRYILDGEIEVFVANGFEGNLIIKTMEGTANNLVKFLKKHIYSRLIYKIGGMLLKNVFKKLKSNMDYRYIGGALLMGINGLVVKAHGSSDVKAFLGAINQVKNALEKEIIKKFEEKI